MAPETWAGRTRQHSRCVVPGRRGPISLRRRGHASGTSLDAVDMERKLPKPSRSNLHTMSTSLRRLSTDLGEVSSASEDDLTPVVVPALCGVEDSSQPLSSSAHEDSRTTMKDQEQRIKQLEAELTTSHSEIQRLRTLALENGAGDPPKPTTKQSLPASNHTSKPIALATLPVQKSLDHANEGAQVAAKTASCPTVVPPLAGASGTLKAAARGTTPNDEGRKSPCRYWTAEEHVRFLEGLEKYGHKDIKAISRHVETRNATQVRTHAQKYYLRLAREASKGNNYENPLEALQNPVTRPSVDSHSGNPVPKAALEAAKEQAAKMAAKGGSLAKPGELTGTEQGSDAYSSTTERRHVRERKEANMPPRKRQKSKFGEDGHMEDVVDEGGAGDGDQSEMDVAGSVADDEESGEASSGWDDTAGNDDGLDNLPRSKSMQTIISLLSSNPTARIEGVDPDQAAMGLFEGQDGDEIKGVMNLSGEIDDRSLAIGKLASLPLNIEIPDLSDIGDIALRVMV